MFDKDLYGISLLATFGCNLNPFANGHGRHSTLRNGCPQTFVKDWQDFNTRLHFLSR